MLGTSLGLGLVRNSQEQSVLDRDRVVKFKVYRLPRHTHCPAVVRPAFAVTALLKLPHSPSAIVPASPVPPPDFY